jgi:hypothetical protein
MQNTCICVLADDVVVLGREEVEATMPAILEAHGIAEDRSKDVRDQSVLPRQCLGILAGTADGAAAPPPRNGSPAASRPLPLATTATAAPSAQRLQLRGCQQLQ